MLSVDCASWKVKKRKEEEKSRENEGELEGELETRTGLVHA